MGRAIEVEIYPEENEIYEFFLKFIHFDNLKDFFKQKGIFYTTSKQNDIAQYASKIIYGFEDFEKIKSITSTKQKYQKISGFQIITTKSIQEIKDFFVIGHIINENNQLRVSNVNFDKNDEIIKVEYKFKRKTPGKMNLISAEDRQGEFLIEKQENNLNKIVLFNHSKNEDYTIIKEIINSIKEDEKQILEIFPIILENLPLNKRIQLMDAIILNKFKDWKFEEVILIRIKKLIDDGDSLSEDNSIDPNNAEELNDDEITTEIIEKADLAGINDAILRGHNLRENAFVKKCETEFFYFPSIILKMTHEYEPYIMNLQVQFKFRPEMPEVTIEETYIIENNEIKQYEFEVEFRKKTLNQYIYEIIRIFNEVSFN